MKGRFVKDNRVSITWFTGKMAGKTVCSYVKNPLPPIEEDEDFDYRWSVLPYMMEV